MKPTESSPEASAEFSAALKFDKEVNLALAVAPSRNSIHWKKKTFKISDFVKRLSVTKRTDETIDEYFALPKAQQDEIKDSNGAFVGASLKGGRRRKSDVANRTCITTDIDFATSKTLEVIKKYLKNVSHTIYSTHKSAPKKPRYRLIIWTDRVMFPDEYQAATRKICEAIDIEVFDTTGFDINRLYYFPTTSSDGEYIFYHNDADFLNVDKVLARYGADDAWKNIHLWPRSSKETKNMDRLLKRQQNPLEKRGLVGAFCRVVSIGDALEKYLGGVYRKDSDDRYTYLDGSSTGGLAICEGMFAYSHHESDPASHEMCNAFDLIRLHKFGHEDANVGDDVSGAKRPSYVAMAEWARGVDGVKAELIKSNIDIDVTDFDQFDNFEDKKKDKEYKWETKLLQLKENGEVKPTYINAVHIITHDPELAGIMRFNEFSQTLERVDGDKVSDWGDADSLRLRQYVDRKYKTDFPAQKVVDAINSVGYKKGYHPVRNYLESLEWDGVERVETMFIDYLGAEDNIYTREVAMCVCTAAVSRIFEPGFKFDFAVTLVGGQGLGKTTFIRELGLRKWYGELLSFENQKAMEQIAGKWIVEITELSATNKNELEQQKSFLSAQNTRVRMAYGRYPINFLRQQVFFGSTNRDEFLKDSTGNRRWLPIKCNVKLLDYEKLRLEVDQIWAEAYGIFWAQGRTVLLSEAAQIIAFGEQENRREADPWEGIISAWLDTEAYVDRYDTMLGSMEGPTYPRDRVCIAEVWEDCLGMSRQQQTKQPDRMRIAAILDRQQGKWKRSKWKKSFGVRFGQQKAWENIEIAKQKVPF